MKKYLYSLLAVLLLGIINMAIATEDRRQFVQLPEMMQNHMMANMRDHLNTLNDILIYMKNGELDKASEIAETRLGMSSLEVHGASHMAEFMPEGMRHPFRRCNRRHRGVRRGRRSSDRLGRGRHATRTR